METLKGIFTRRFGLLLLCAVWLIVLIVPPMRLMWRVQVKEAAAVINNAPESKGINNVSGDAPVNWSKIQPQELGWLAAHYPNDVRVLAKVAEWRTLGHSKEAIAEYDRLLQRFPHTPWLIANRLRFSEMWLFLSRDDGELVNRPPGFKWHKNYTAADVTQAINIARIGRRVESKNCFYDILLAKYLFMLHRDTEAFEALRAGSQKPYYDDHTLQDAQVSVVVRGLIRPLLFEDKYLAIGAIILPHLAQHRQLARVVVWQGVKAERAGDHQRALRIYGDIARLGARMRESKTSQITALLGSAITAIAWAGTKRKAPSNALSGADRADERQQIQFMADSFARYAAAHGRADLAAETYRLRDAMLNFDAMNSSREFANVFSKVDEEHISVVRGAWWGGVSLLLQLLVLVPTWLWLSLFLRRTDPKLVSRYDYLSTSLIVVAITTGLGAGAIMLGAGRVGWRGWLLWGVDNEIPVATIAVLRNLLVFTPVAVGALLCLIAILWRYRKSRKADRHVSVEVSQSRPVPSEVMLTPLGYLLKWSLTLGTAAAWLTFIILPVSSDVFAETYPALAIALSLTCVCFVRWALRIKHAVGDANAAPHIASGALTVATILSWLFTFLLPDGPYIAYPFALMLTALYLLLLIFKWSRSPRTPKPHRSLMIRHGLCWYRDTLGACIVSASAMYLLLLLASLPGRQALDNKMDQFIQKGEIAMMKAQK